MIPAVARHRTAMSRTALSRPLAQALADNVLSRSSTVFDYGCGRGEDVELLTAEGITCGGWDPTYRPEAPWKEADVVNLGYVINVIENEAERREALRRAWSLARSALVR